MTTRWWPLRWRRMCRRCYSRPRPQCAGVGIKIQWVRGQGIRLLRELGRSGLRPSPATSCAGVDDDTRRPIKWGNGVRIVDCRLGRWLRRRNSGGRGGGRAPLVPGRPRGGRLGRLVGVIAAAELARTCAWRCYARCARTNAPCSVYWQILWPIFIQ